MYILEAMTKVLGIPEKEANILLLANKYKTVELHQLEKELDLQQPVISITVKNIQCKGWMRECGIQYKGLMRECGSHKNSARGRLTKSFELAYPLRTILNECIEYKQKELSKIMDSIADIEREIKNV